MQLHTSQLPSNTYEHDAAPDTEMEDVDYTQDAGNPPSCLAEAEHTQHAGNPSPTLILSPNHPDQPNPSHHPSSVAPSAQSSMSSQPGGVLGHLQRLLGTGTLWRSPEQRNGVAALLKLERDVIVALPTGIGKSMIALLPTQVEHAITVIIVPLIALVDDWISRLEAFKIPFEHFEGAANPRLTGNCNVILVSSDVARHLYWKRAISDLQSKRPIARFIFDEAHYYFSDFEFRGQAFQRAYELRASFPCQFVLLSATLPPAARTFLITEMALINPITIEAPSARPELRYLLLQGPESTIDKIQALVTRCKNTLNWKPEDRYLIFVNTLQLGETIAAKLGIQFYHADSQEHPISDEERRRRMNDWAAGLSTGVVCTSALGAGYDYKSVRLTIHANTPHDMVLFNQQSGRAGRDGKEAWCAIISTGRARGGKDKTTGKFVGVEQVSSITTSKVWPDSCFRYNSSKVMEGEANAKDCLQLPDNFLPCSACSSCTSFQSVLVPSLMIDASTHYLY